MIGVINAFAFPSTPVLDNFNRADENPIAGIWTNGIVGTTGGCQVLSNVLVRRSTVHDCYVTQTYGYPLEAYTTMPNAFNHSTGDNLYLWGCILNAGTAGADGYIARQIPVTGADNDTTYIARIDDGVPTNLTSAYTRENANNDKLGIRVESNGDINVYLDGGSGWTKILTANDTTYDCSTANIGLTVDDNDHQMDDFGGGIGSNPFMIILEAK